MRRMYVQPRTGVIVLESGKLCGPLVSGSLADSSKEAETRLDDDLNDDMEW